MEFQNGNGQFFKNGKVEFNLDLMPLNCKATESKCYDISNNGTNGIIIHFKCENGNEMETNGLSLKPHKFDISNLDRHFLKKPADGFDITRKDALVIPVFELDLNLVEDQYLNLKKNFDDADKPIHAYPIGAGTGIVGGPK
jgi:hypothetical protein